MKKFLLGVIVGWLTAIPLFVKIVSWLGGRTLLVDVVADKLASFVYDTDDLIPPEFETYVDYMRARSARAQSRLGNTHNAESTTNEDK